MKQDQHDSVTSLDLRNTLLKIRGLFVPAFSHEFRNILSNIKICRDYVILTAENDKKAELLTDIDEQITFGAQVLLRLMDATTGDNREQRRTLLIPEDISFHLKLIRTICRKENISWVNLADESFTITADPADILVMLGEYLSSIFPRISFIPEENRSVTISTRKSEDKGSLVITGPFPEDWTDTAVNTNLPLSEVLSVKTGCSLTIARRHSWCDICCQFPLK